MIFGTAGVLWFLAGALGATQEDVVERQAQRYKEQLNLSEDQLLKVRDLLKRQYDELRAVLTDEQKGLLEEQLRRFGGRGGGPGGGFAFGRGGGLPPTDELKKSLGLTEDQAAKIDELREATRQEMRNFAQDSRNQRRNPDDWQKFMEKLRDETSRKVRELLNDEQKPKFDEILKSAAGPAPPPPPGGRPGQSLEERLGRVMEGLKIEKASEAEAIQSVVHKVIDLQDKLEAYQRDARTKLDDLVRNRELSDEAVGDKLDELRKGQKEIEKALALARQELSEIVTNRQELELIRRGILK